VHFCVAEEKGGGGVNSSEGRRVLLSLEREREREREEGGREGGRGRERARAQERERERARERERTRGRERECGSPTHLQVAYNRRKGDEVKVQYTRPNM
jgi:hypothetical protein